MLEYEGRVYRELRCEQCHALLAEEYVFFGRLRIKCRKCKAMNSVSFKASTKLLKELSLGGSEKELLGEILSKKPKETNLLKLKKK